MFRYISQIIAQFSTPQKIIALSLILLSIVIITIGPSLIDDKRELKEDLLNKDQKIKALESDLNRKDSLIRKEQSNCTNQIVEREKEFISMLDNLKDKAKRGDDKIIRQTNLESFGKGDSSRAHNTSTIIVKSDNTNIIKEIDLLKKKIKN